MRKVLQVFYDEVLASRNFTTGLVYKLEGGDYVVAAQDGFVQPNQIHTEQSLNDLRERAVQENEKAEVVS